jgi:2-dehydropantoate 2-reductase
MKPQISPLVHILGAGNIGSLVAAELAGHIPPENVILMLRNKQKYDRFVQQGQTVFIDKPLGRRRIVEQKLNAIYSPGGSNGNMDNYKSLDNLIITTPANSTRDALAPYAQYLNRNSTVVILQNGMGVFEELCKEFWDNPETRPTFVLGITSHGVHAVPHTMFNFRHVGTGYLKLAIVPRDIGSLSNDTVVDTSENRTPDNLEMSENIVEEYLRQELEFDDSDKTSDPVTTSNLNAELTNPVTTMSAATNSNNRSGSTSVPELVQALLLTKDAINTELVPYGEFMFDQYEKLIVNACINPLTAILNCKNGELRHQPVFNRLIMELVDECCWIIKRQLKEQVPSDLHHLVETRFRPLRMAGVVRHVCSETSQNRSSMLQQVAKQGDTEIDYINGFLVRSGRKHRVGTSRNSMLVELVKAKGHVLKRQHTEFNELDMLENS